MSAPYEMAPLADTMETNITPKNEHAEMIDDGLTACKPKPEEPSFTPNIPDETRKPFAPGNRPMDFNLYATKKTVAQGMMDLALLTANSNQLRYVLESGSSGAYFYISVTLISLSIFLQLLVGMALILIGRSKLHDPEHIHRANQANNWVVLGVFLITVINIFASALTIDSMDIQISHKKQEL